MAGTYEQATLGEPNSTAGPKWLAQFKGMNEMLNSENDVSIEGTARGNLGRWYTPTEVATEQERESASFGKLTTPDEVTGVVLPKNGLIVVAYRAKIKSSVSNAGRSAIFLGANQLKRQSVTVEANTEGTGFNSLCSTPVLGLASREATSAFSTTGELFSGASEAQGGGVTYIFAEAGTYAISVQFKATSGKVAVKERVLQVGVIGA